MTDAEKRHWGRLSESFRSALIKVTEALPGDVVRLSLRGETEDGRSHREPIAVGVSYRPDADAPEESSAQTRNREEVYRLADELARSLGGEPSAKYRLVVRNRKKRQTMELHLARRGPRGRTTTTTYVLPARPRQEVEV